MHRQRIIGAVTFGAVFAGLVAVGPVGAAPKQKQVDQITCDEFLALDPDDQQRIAY